MEVINIRMSATTEDRLTDVREELNDLSPSSSLDETVLRLIEVAEGNDSVDFDVGDRTKRDSTDYLL